MSAIINGSSPSVTFSDGTTQATSAIVSGYVPYANLPAGSVLQVVQGTYSTQATTTSSSNTDTGLTATITPKYSTSKIFVVVMNNVRTQNTSGTYSTSYFDLMRGATMLSHLRYQTTTTYGAECSIASYANISYLDSPATTSATTYKLQMSSNEAAITTYSCLNGNIGTITLMEIAA